MENIKKNPKKKYLATNSEDSSGYNICNKKKGSTNTNLNRKLAGSNWNNNNSGLGGTTSNAGQEKITKKKVKHNKNLTKYVAMDCEMVGIGSNGIEDMLARVSIVNQNGDVLMDKYVKPREIVTDYRTRVSGIRPKDIENGEEFEKVQNQVVCLLKDKILVGHSINNDLAVLFIRHPYKYIRDTAKYKPLGKLVANGATPSLKRLAKVILGLDIQGGEHDSVEDARAAMSIYNRFSTDWEAYLKKKYNNRDSRSNRRRV